MAFHRLPATPATVRVGAFDASIPPALTIEPGDTVEIETVNGASRAFPPPGSPFRPTPAMLAIDAATIERAPGHIVTGPVAVRGAEPGDTLEVRVDAIALGADWGFCGFRPLAGTLPHDFETPYLTHIAVDRTRNTCRMPYGLEIPLAPFFGVMGVAPPPRYGRISTVEPREHGGNIDLKELVAGTSLFLPVWAPGALFSTGDGHGCQGDGEVCINALEMCLDGTFTFLLHRRADGTEPLRHPRAETPTHFISLGFDSDLDEAMRRALREMIAFICARSSLSREEAYQLCSLAVDFRVTQTVNGEKGVHGMLRKGLLF